MDRLQVVIERLEGLFDTFNAEYFQGELEKPVISVSPDLTGGSFGWVTTWKAWKTDKDDHEGFYEINICAEHLSRPFKEVCATLLHEMVHLWNLQVGIKDTSRGCSYHNMKFKEQAEQRGLIIDKSEKYGWTITSLQPETEEFIESLNFEGFQLRRTKMVKAEKVKGTRKSSSRKYVCPDCGTIVRATKEVRIGCMECDIMMEEEEKDE